MNPNNPIGVMDSGVGGIFVLRQLTRLLPHEYFIFYGDQGHAPYGSRDTKEIQRLVMDVAEALQSQQIKCLVVACNTATAAAVALLRQELPIPVIGTEPALKPALLAFPGESVAVMATPSTAASEKFQHLRKKTESGDIRVFPCPGLATLVEESAQGSPERLAYLTELFGDFHPGAVVLGCTHYSYLKEDLRTVLGNVALFDGAEGVARQTQRILQEAKLLRQEGEGSVEFLSSGGAETLARLKEFWSRTEHLA